MRKLPGCYQKGKFIGKGGFARCYELTNTETNEVYAVKIVSKASIAKPRAQAKLKSEISIHRSISHEKVVRFYDYYEDVECVYIILEYCPNQTLNEFLRKRSSRRMAEPEAMFYIYDLISALKYLHKNKILHRDLKLGNLFLDANMRIKIGDFGLAAQLESEGERRRTICGTPNYIAPEILDGKNGHSYEVDIWSLGVILYTMLIGKPPFETTDVKATYRKIRYNQYSFPDNVPISGDAKQLIQFLLQTDPKARPQLTEIEAHSWLQLNKLPPPVPTSVADNNKYHAQHAGNHGNGINHGNGMRPGPNSAQNMQGCIYTGIGGAASSRSETPDRCLDFARLDSPAVGRYPLRERSPPNRLMHQQGMHQQGMHQQGMHQQGIHHQSPGVPPSNLHHTTSEQMMKSRTSGRPPLYNGNDENAIPYTSSNQNNLAYSDARLPSRPSSARPPIRNNFSNTTPRSSLQQNSADRGRALRPMSARTGGGLPSQQNSGIHSARKSSRHSPSSRTPIGSEKRGEKDFASSPAVFLDALGYRYSPSAGTAQEIPKPKFETQKFQELNDGLPELWVTKWVDYSSKYGIGYVFSDNSIGVYFNDSTKIILENQPNSHNNGFEYITRRTMDKPEQRSMHSLENFPDELRKKVTLLKHFKNYLLIAGHSDRKDNSQATLGESGLIVPPGFMSNNRVISSSSTASTRGSNGPGSSNGVDRPYVKKWMKNRHAIMFQLSNKIVQVIFFDRTEVVLSSKAHMVTYVDKKGHRSAYPLQSVMEISNTELAKRLRYTKDILVNLLSGARTGGSTNGHTSHTDRASSAGGSHMNLQN